MVICEHFFLFLADFSPALFMFYIVYQTLNISGETSVLVFSKYITYNLYHIDKLDIYEILSIVF